MFSIMLKEMLSSNSKVSSKRTVTFLAFAAMVIAFGANLFFNLSIDEFMFEAMEWIVIAGLGFTASEKFSTKKTTDDGANV
jgi:hypothetical protein